MAEARDSGAGPLAARDEGTFEIIVMDAPGFDITTTSLPDAVLEQGYDATVAADGGLPPYDWKIVGNLPDGLIDNIDQTTWELQIVGQASVVGTFPLLFEVTDSRGRNTSKALAVRVLEAAPVMVTPPDDGGCTCVTPASDGLGLGLGLFGLLGLALFVRRRR